MDQALLVNPSDIDIGGRILEALHRAGVSVTLCMWHDVPELGESEFIVATPLYDDGPLAANRRVIEALQAAGIYRQVPLLRLSVRSPSDPLVRSLARDLKRRDERFLHIVMPEHPRPRYTVILSPVTSPGGVIPAKHLDGEEDLQGFLERLHLSARAIDDALAELRHRGSTSIFPLRLTRDETRKLGLA